MANQQLVDYINTMRGKGSTDEQITAALMNAGWLEEDISAAISLPAAPVSAAPGVGAPQIMHTPQAAAIIVEEVKTKSDIMGFVYLGSIVALLISLFLPFVNIIFFSFNLFYGLNHLSGSKIVVTGPASLSTFSNSFSGDSYGTMFAVFLVVISVLFFWKRAVSQIAGLIVNAGAVVFVIYKLVSSGAISKLNEGFGAFGGNVFNLLGIGFYLAVLSILCSIVFSILSLIKSRQ